MDLRSFTLWLRRGFSLIEVTMAMGIISFAFVALLGLMPVGLNIMRQAMDATAEGMIVQKISSQAQMIGFTNLVTTFSGKTFYYDEDGSANTSPNVSRYRIKTQVVVPSYPGVSSFSSTISPIDSNLMILKIQIEVAPGSSTAAVAKTTNFYNVIIPNSGN